MHIRTRPRAAATGLAIAGIAAVAATPLAPVPQSPSAPAVSRDVRLVAAEVPPGGLLTSFLGNQVVNCSAICGPLIITGVTAAVTTLQTPVVFVNTLQSGNLGKAIGLTAASVTGPTNAALAAAIDADATVAVPRASNTFEVAVVGLLNIVPAAAGGLPAIGAAIEAAREQTFLALNSPVGGPPLATPMPQGVVEIAALGAIHVGEAVIFPAFNDALQATVGVPNAAAQELAATGDPVRAAVAGVNSAVGSASAATNTVGNAVVKAVKDIRTAAGQAPLGNVMTHTQKVSAAATFARQGHTPERKMGMPATHADPVGSHPVRNVASTVQRAVRSVVKSVSANPPNSVGNRRGG